MCGICGLLALTPHHSAEQATVEAMCASLRHRGPEDHGVYVAGPVGLGVARLAIIDVPGGHQPLCNADGTVWGVQNGEIYNYRELRAELQAKGHTFRTAGDTEVLVHLYEEYGDAFVTRLRGMFALAIWDARPGAGAGRGRLVLARDRLGIKPLHYAVHAGRLVFGSEIKALLAAGHPRALDASALHDYLTFNYVPAPRSMFEGIRKLPAGHLLVWDGGERGDVGGDGNPAGGGGHSAGESEDSAADIRIRPYWDFPPAGQSRAYSGWGEGHVGQYGNGRQRSGGRRDWDGLAGELEAHLEDAVAAAMVSDVPVGAFLSGGIDSSLVVALMSRYTDRPVQTFSIGFREDSYNELPYARQVAERYRTVHHELVVEPHIEDVIHGLVGAFDEPFADSSAVATWYVSELAARHTKVVLSGDGGDEVFGGYVIYQADRLAGLYRRLPAALGTGLLPRLAGRLPASDAKMSWDLKIRRFVENASRDPIAAHGAWRMIFSEAMKERLYARSAGGASHPAGHDSLDLLRAQFDAYPSADLLNRFMVVDAKVSLVDDMLTKVDRTSMAHSLEVRVPLLDHVLVEWMTGLPSDTKVRGLTLKALFKDVARRVLPAEVVNRPKAGFHVPVPGWLKRELRPLVDEVLGPDTVRRQGIFDPAEVTRLVEDHAAGRANYSRNLWGLLMFGLWYDRYLGG